MKVAQRFQQMKSEDEKNGKQLKLASKTINVTALAVVNANKNELAKVEEFFNLRHPSLSRGTSYTSGGSGSSAGSQAGGQVGLSRQMSGSSQRQLSGY